MNAWKIGGFLVCGALICGKPASAQTPPPQVFLDGAVMTDRDPTDFFEGSQRGTAGRGAIGVHLSPYNSLRFEIDVPQWRVHDFETSKPMWCAEASACLSTGFVPAHTTTHTEVRGVSYAFLYGRHLPWLGPVQISLLGGGAIEQRDRRYSSTIDELSPDGHVLRHHVSRDDRSNGGLAGVLGIDAEIRLTQHLSVTPQFRFHTFPYPEVSIVRPGVAVRWRF